MKSKIFPIAGDASFRKFFRIILNKKSRIIVISKKEKYKNLVAYAAVNKFLRNKKVLTPKLFQHDYQKGVILLEDFGDLSLYKILIRKKNKLPYYKKIVDLLIKIQKIKPNSKIKTIINKSHLINKYSNKYLHKESDLFFKWYLPLVLSNKKILKIQENLKKILTKLYKNINLRNSYFVHRDFHVQNLMKVGTKIGLIDTQDALIGNPAYDLTSLIDDVRIVTSRKLKDKIYDYYMKKTPITHKKHPKKFLEDFNILSIQRNLKIIGIFSRLSTRDKKDKYLKYIPYAWKLLESRMNSRVFSDLKNILDKNIKKNIRRKIIYK